MDKYLKEQLLKVKNVSFYNKDKLLDINDLDKYNEFIIKSKDFTNTDNNLLFTFENYLIHPFEGFDFHIKFNKGINIPFNIMQGKIIKTVGKMYYLKLKGFFVKTDICVHCLKKEDSNPLCKTCFKKFNVNDIEDVTWEGYVPIKGIKEIRGL